MGVDAGDPDQLMPGGPSNPHGHFEHLPAVDLNDEILAALDSHWLGPRFEPGSAGALAGESFGHRARALVSGGFDTDQPFFIKDPRFCLLIPFWRAVLDEPAIVLVLRHPAESANSLHQRDGYPVSFALALWEEYMTRFVNDAAGSRVHVLDYASLLEDPGSTLDALQAFVSGLAPPGWVPSDAAHAIDGEARSVESADDELLTTGQRDLWRLLESLGSGILGSPELPPAEQRSLHPVTVDFAAAVGPVLERARNDALVLADRVADVQRLQDQLAAERSQMLGELAEARKQHGLALDREVAALRELADTAQDLARALRKVTQLEDRASDAEGALQLARSRLDRLEEGRRFLERELHSAQERGASAERSLAVYEGSRAGQAVRTYWRVAEPVKRLARPKLSRPRNATSLATEREPVNFPDAGDPLVSIVIPVYGELDHTAACLRSISEHTADVPIEVIVVDDRSPDRSVEYLQRCENVVLVENDENLGYLRSTNAGAARARAPFICLLNNDTTVTPGWIGNLVGLIESSPDIGAVGAKLVYPDGVLQEAGGIIWSDGSGWNWGRGGDPAAWDADFVREVDYCSAACLLVRTDAWRRLGGFDDRFAPAYYEDADLAFSLRSIGYRVMYQPAAVVVHHEGVSHGTDESTGLKAHQVLNRDRFAEKWADELEQQHASGTPPRLASWRGSGPRAIIVDHDVPAPDRDAGSLRIDAVLDLLAERGFKVTFVPHNRRWFSPYSESLQQRGIEIFHGHGGFGQLVAERAPELAFVWASRPDVGVDLLPLARLHAPGVPFIYDMVDFHGLRLARQSAVDSDTDVAPAAHATAMTEIERALIRASDLTIAITDTDARAVHELEPEAAVSILPMIHRAERSTVPFRERSGLVFIGSWQHMPNRDALHFLGHEIMPLVWKTHPDIELQIVGSDLPGELRQEFDPRVEVVGWVEDLGSVLDRARLSVAPLRFGAGMKGKIGESLIRGLPVVTTSVGAEGFGDATAHLTVADDAEAFAAAIVDSYDDEEAWVERSRHGASLAEDLLGFTAARRSLTEALKLAGVETP